MGTSQRMHSRFRQTRWRAGYSPGEVDEFVTVVEDALRSPTPPRVSASEIAQHRFTPVRMMPGYDPDEVDDYLDVAERRLREREGRS
jgi:DivIVA domain-containing protein